MEYIQLKPTIKDLLRMRQIAFASKNKHTTIETIKLRLGMTPIALLVSKYTNKFYVSIEDSVIIGFAMLRFRTLRALFVDPQHYKKGVGSGLLKKALENYRFKLVYAKPLKSAITFYTSNNFQKLNKGKYYSWKNQHIQKEQQKEK